MSTGAASRRGRLGIIAGGGQLPVILAAACPDGVTIAFEGMDCNVPEARRLPIERIGGLLDLLRGEGVGRVVMAGSLIRPVLDPGRLDEGALRHMDRIAPALQGQGDDALLRMVVDLFEAEGFVVLGAHDVVPDLVAAEGAVAGPAPQGQDRTDAARGRAILDALSVADVGQACVVAQGLCLGVETAQGTDAMLGFVAATRDALGRGGGVLVKAPKAGQELRVDMPAIGPDTIAKAAAAGLSGICIAAGKVLILDRRSTEDAARAAGLALWAEAFG